MALFQYVPTYLFHFVVEGKVGPLEVDVYMSGSIAQVLIS